MSKHIVFCADGTWDGPENTLGTYPSNVLKLFNALAGTLTVGEPTAAEQERLRVEGGATIQIAKYIHGVGDSQNWLVKQLGGGVGAGLIERVLRGYTFVSRNYTEGDAIVLVGFSRGAYTARALGGLIATMGLLDWAALGLKPDGADGLGYGYAAAAWYAYQQQRHQAVGTSHWLARLQKLVALAPVLTDWIALHPKYRATKPRISAIAVWDTVGALGIPKLIDGGDERLDMLRFTDTQLSPQVDHGFHAIAADEERVDFTPTLWDPDPARIRQCFFAGAHADVGGGYPRDESQLSDHSLEWMATQLAQLNVRFASNPPVPAVEGALGPMHRPWTSPGFELRPHDVRKFPD